MNIEITFDVFAAWCDYRRATWKQAECIPDCVYEYAMEFLEQTGGLSPEKNTPMYIVDNLAAGGSWEHFDECRKFKDQYKSLSDDELMAAVENEAVAVFPEEKLILWNLGL